MDYSEYDVVLLPTFSQVEDWRRAQAASRGGGMLGQAVSTFPAWTAGLWELHGDGRALVTPMQREAAMRLAFARPGGLAAGGGGSPTSAEGGEGSSPAPGLSALAARCERLAAGVPAFDAAVDAAREGRAAAGLSPRELLFLQGIARYRDLLARRDLVEPGEACAVLAREADRVFPRRTSVLVAHAAPPDWHMEGLFAACPRLRADYEPAAGAEGVGRAPRGVQLRFAFPAGVYAAPALVADLLRGLAPDETAAVCSADPLALYRQLEPALARAGIAGCVQAPVRFGETDFGRLYLLLADALAPTGWSPAALADALASPFAGIPRLRADELDARLRADRIARLEDYLPELRELSPEFPWFERLVRRPCPPDVLLHFEEAARALPGRSPAWRSEQLAAIAGLRTVLSMADELGEPHADMRPVIEGIAVPASMAGTAPGAAAGPPRVLVTTQAVAAQLPPGSRDMLVACDLTSASYPVADKDDAASILLGKLGLEPRDTALARARRVFHALARVPRRAFVCLRPLNDVDGNPTYPCAVLEELVDAYRADPSREDDLDDVLGVPEPFAGEALQRGEELLYANAQAAPEDARQPLEAPPPAPGRGAVGPAVLGRVLLPRRVPGGPALRRSPSPSQIELYLECPYKWFVQSRLGAGSLEEEFGPRERGSFAHEVLERFYRAFNGRDPRKVDESSLGEARGLMRAIAVTVEREMRGRAPGAGRLVAADRLEQRELAQQEDRLVRYLDYECRLLPTFVPTYLEYGFDAGHPADYAGCKLVGTVDRIDVDASGRAVVLDYKSSVGAAHDIAGKDAANPGKVQARIYAQMVRRELGLDVVGALYASYGRRQGVAGAVDARAIEAAHLPGARAGGPWCIAGGGPPSPETPFAELSFADMLDRTEEAVARAVERMERGDIAPAPASPDACACCPAVSCPKRGA